jgi:Tfp pilus assembly protein PilF
VTRRGEAGRGPGAEDLFAAALARHQAGLVVEAEKLYRQVLQRDSAHLGARCNIAQALHHLGKLDAAARAYLWVIARGTNAPELHNGLGMVLQELGRQDDAIAAYRRGLAYNPGNADLFHSLGIALRARDCLDEAIGAYRRALSVAPTHALAHFNLGNAYRELGDLDRSIGCYRQCLSLRPDFGAAHHHLAMALLAKGDLAAGWGEFEWRRDDVRRQRRRFAGREWQGERQEGARLLLHAEEGLGTSLQFVRYAPMAAALGLEVTLEVQAPLVRLVSGLPGVHRTIAAGDDSPPHDLQCSLLSLPRIFKTDLQTIPASIPYLSADPVLAAAWRVRLADCRGLKVGIAWRGNPHHLRDRKRSLDLAWFLDVLDRPGLDVISLQKDFTRAEFPPGGDPARLIDLSRSLSDFADTAALIVNLDLVISVDTAVCHLAGALGIPVWTLIDFAPDWRWLMRRSDSPWYPTMRLFRQARLGEWRDVAGQIKDALSGFRPRR